MPLAAFADPKVIEAAKKEGELAWWSTIAQDQSQRLVGEFMKRYPFIKANYWRSVLHPDRAQSAQKSFKLYREIFSLD